MDDPVILIFQQDLRIQDNPALIEAIKKNKPIIPIYVLDDASDKNWKMGRASKVWLEFSLKSLQESLKEIGLKLILRKGKLDEELKQIIKETNAREIFFNRHYEPNSFLSDDRLEELFKRSSLDFHSYKANLLVEPWEAKTSQGSFFKVFTRFLNYCLKDFDFRAPLRAPKKAIGFAKPIKTETLQSFDLLPKKPNWAKEIINFWEPGEKGAHKRLAHFIKKNLNEYSRGRDIPSMETTSYLSPHLHFGEISPYIILEALKQEANKEESTSPNIDKFISEVFWREFSYHLLYHFKELPEEPFVSKFKNFPWDTNKKHLRVWQRGQTGYPIVDAGMRELWQIGWMHNRVRMIVASFLTKDLLIPWQKGASWFWDTLVDADLANNSASWQWVAGSGADAAPYFRIFNPTLQGQKFDPEGSYVRKWVPELKNLPSKYIHDPWNAPQEILAKSGVRLGENYPYPIVDHSHQREKALEAFKKLSK